MDEHRTIVNWFELVCLQQVEISNKTREVMHCMHGGTVFFFYETVVAPRSHVAFSHRLLQLPPSLLLDCGALHTLSLHGNVIKLDRLEQMEGYESLEGRRREKVDKQIAGNVMITSKNLEQGIER